MSVINDQWVLARRGPKTRLDPMRPYAAVVRSSLHIGGWDLVRRGPKPLRRGVAAGSVYYVEAGDSAIRSYVPISDMHEQGFGLTLAGTVPKGES